MLAGAGPASFRTRSLRSFEVVLTTACNLSCSYCFENARTNSRLNWPTLRAALDLLLQSEKQEVSLTFYGGEPLLEFPLIERAICYVEAEKAPDKVLDFHIITNGLLLDRETVSFLARHKVETQISFDGTEAAQDLRAPGTFDRLDRLLVRLRETEIHFFNELCSVAITVSSHNVAHLAESFAYFLDRGVRTIAISPLVTHDPGWRPDLIEIAVEQIAAILQMSRLHHRRTGETPFVPFQTNNGDAPLENGRPAMCSAASPDELALGTDGRVHRCVMLVDSYQRIPDGPLTRRLEQLQLGDIRGPDLDRRLEAFPAAVAAAGIFADKRDKRSSYRKCDGCRYLHTCSICPVSICHIPGNEDPNRVADLPCALNLVVLAAREKFLGETRAEPGTGRASRSRRT
jgi:sulfatase maturation enzyme AslB (radical SAM superfamily)